MQEKLCKKKFRLEKFAEIAFSCNVPYATFAPNDVRKIKTVIRGANGVKSGIRALKWEKTRKTSTNWAKTVIECFN